MEEFWIFFDLSRVILATYFVSTVLVFVFALCSYGVFVRYSRSVRKDIRTVPNSTPNSGRSPLLLLCEFYYQKPRPPEAISRFSRRHFPCTTGVAYVSKVRVAAMEQLGSPSALASPNDPATSHMRMEESAPPDASTAPFDE